MPYGFHVHYGPSQPGLLDGYSRQVSREELRKEITRLAAWDAEAWRTVETNLDNYLDQFTTRLPVRIPAAVLLAGLPGEYETRLQSDEYLGRSEYEPLYGEQVKQLRAQLDERIVYQGEPAPRLLDYARPYVEDMRQAKNLINNFVMTSTFRIVISRVFSCKDGDRWLVITARDTDRQDEKRLEVTFARATGPSTFEYYGGSGTLPSSSLESHWNCHSRLSSIAPQRAKALLHCHALRALSLDERARKNGKTIDEVLPEVVTVPGVSRTPAYGKAVAEALGSGKRLVFRAGEGTWAAEATAVAAAETTIEVVDAIERAQTALSA